MGARTALVGEFDVTRPAPPWIDAEVDRTRLWVALIVTLSISRLPEIVARDGLGSNVAWMPWAILAVTAGLWIASRAVPILRPLERFLAVMILVNAFVAGLPVLLESTVWQTLVPSSTPPM